jgi:glycosyltransferase involved in cell wall biosynthesis
MTAFRLGILSTHPIQYYSPWYRALAAQPGIDVTVFYAHRQSAQGQAAAGFGVPFEWDVPLLDGYAYEILPNRAGRPSVETFWGCNTPAVMDRIAQGDFDAVIVHGWYNLSYWQAIYACWRAGTPVMIRGDSQLLTRRSPFRRWLKCLTHRWFIPRFDAYLVVGQRAREYYQAYGAEPKRMFPVPHFVDNNYFKGAAAHWRPLRGELRRQWTIQSDSIVFLFAGKFIPKKRPLDFVHAVARASRANPAIEGVMAGDGPLRGEIEAAVHRDRAPIRLLGFLNQSQIPQAYAAADALVLPSDAGETWGLVVNEAMASGLAVIVSDEVGCGPDLVHEGQTGYLFPCGNIEQLAEAIGRMASQPRIMLEMGEKAAERIAACSVATAVRGTLEALSGTTSINKGRIGVSIDSGCGNVR